MQAEMDYTMENLIEFYQVAAMRGKARRIRLTYLLGGAVIVLVGAYYGLQCLRGDEDIVGILLAVIGLYFGLHMLWIGSRFYRYFAARALKSIPENARHCYFSFEGDQILISNRMKTMSFPYEQFGMIYETERSFLFYINDYNGYVLEKSGLRGSAEELRQLLNGKREAPVERVTLP